MEPKVDPTTRIKELAENGTGEKISDALNELSAQWRSSGLGVTFDNFILIKILHRLDTIKEVLEERK